MIFLKMNISFFLLKFERKKEAIPFTLHVIPGGSLKMNCILYKIIPTMGNISNYQYFHVLSLLEPFSLWNNVD